MCKPFTAGTTDGYVVNTFGPYLANLNDAEIMRIIINEEDGLSSLLKEGDVFILDRGFRDVKSYLESKGYIVLMPALKGKRNQITTTEANESRLVTKLRWVVEAVHGIIGSKFKLLHNQLDNKLLPAAEIYCKIACFLVNFFGKRLNSDLGMQEEIGDYMLSRKTVENSLAKEVQENNWNRKKKPFQQLSSKDVEDFPEMTEKDLKILFSGSYQLTQTVFYLAELCTEDGVINMQYLLKDNMVLRCQVRSRHISRKEYKCYIQYTPNSIGYGGIRRYVCDCANRLRTVCCCSHVATIIYFLSHARYLSKIIRPAEILTKLFDVDKVQAVIEEDSDDDM